MSESMEMIILLPREPARPQAQLPGRYLVKLSHETGLLIWKEGMEDNRFGKLAEVRTYKLPYIPTSPAQVVRREERYFLEDIL
jgi:hypothetical protein